jgi:hypothetical protein
MALAIIASSARVRWLGLALIAGIALHGCGGHAPGAASASGGSADAAAEMPAGAISIGDELYQVPIGADDDGCPRYRLYSPTRLVAQVIYYRSRTGGFTTARQDAACASGARD